MLSNIKKIQDIDLKNKRVLIREDLNVPIKDGRVTSNLRIVAALDTINFALAQGAKVILASHLGRPSEGSYEEKYSLAPVADELSRLINLPVRLSKDYLENGIDMNAGEIVLLENVRFNTGEKANDKTLSDQYANLCDVFVMDAFGTAHRAQASTAGVIDACQALGKPVCAGQLLLAELQALSKALDNPASPVVAVIGGSKVSTKLDILHRLSELCDSIIVGGGIANTFLAAKGVDVGASLYEPELIDSAKEIMKKTNILLPTGVVVAKKNTVDFDDFLDSLAKTTASTKSIENIEADEMVLDVDEVSAHHYADTLKNAKTILFNGPVGVFEIDKFGNGTKIVAKAIADSQGFSIAGGGDTLSAIDKYGIADNIDYLSTGGGAFLEFVEGKALPAIVALQSSS